ncbi:MAG: methyl-accepting chemotaxis protein [Porticoccaceae bacterium]
MKLVKNLKFAHKFGLVLFATFIGFSSIAYLYSEVYQLFSASDSADIKLFEANGLADNVRISILEARRNEKDFILRGDLKYPLKHKKNIENGTNSLIKLIELVGADKALFRAEETLPAIDKIKSSLADYQLNFMGMVELQKDLGLDESSGLLGSLRQAVHEVESVLAEAKQIELTASMLMMRRHEKDFLARKTDKYIGKMESEKENFTTLLNQSSLSFDEKQIIKGLMEKYNKDFLSMVSGTQKVIDQVAIFRDAVHVTEEAMGEIKPILLDAAERVNEINRSVEQQLSDISVVFVSVLSVVSLVVLSVFVLLARDLKRSTTRAISLTQVIAEGDLSADIEIGSKDEFGQQRASLKSMQETLLKIIEGIKVSAKGVGEASMEVSQGNIDLSQRTQEQAASLEEIASSMEEMTSTVNQNAENALQANQLAQEAQVQANKGGEVAAKAVAAMEEINTSSKQIADIIGVIDDIAFQTNLLALNAAVEAARAGEQGRGFAVVASEVRSLSGKSAGASKEIKALIRNSVNKVEEGSKLVNDSGQALEGIVISVQKVSETVSEIAAASQEQSQGIGQVSKAVIQMDEMTQQNAAVVEEVSAASQMMEMQAHKLTDLVEFFKTGNTSAAAQTTAADLEPASREHQTSKANVSQAKPESNNDQVNNNAEDKSSWSEF